jgi:hypothetical protein
MARIELFPLPVESAVAPPGPIITLDAVRELRAKQATRLDRINTLIADAEVKIQKVREQAAPLPSAKLSDSDRRTLVEAGRINAAPRVMTIRQETDATVLPILKEMIAAAELAKVAGERWWDKFSVLRRAVGGQGTDPAAYRGHMAAVLAQAGPVELAAWAQMAIDLSGVSPDKALILADAVARANGARKRDEQPFHNADFLVKLRIVEYEQAQALLRETILDNERAGLRWSEFSRGSTSANALRRIELGLAERDRVRDRSQPFNRGTAG